jgi:hypothetical protein
MFGAYVPFIILMFSLTYFMLLNRQVPRGFFNLGSVRHFKMNRSSVRNLGSVRNLEKTAFGTQ